MKKLLGLLLASLLVLTACGNNAKDPEPAEGAMKVGTGIVTTESVTPATEEADGKYQVDTYFATIVLKGDKIVATYIDTAQNSQTFDLEGNVTGQTVRGTKKELGDDYGMTKNPAATAEWYVQIAALEAWTIGQTVAEVLALETYEKDESHPAVPAESTDISSSVTITVHKYLEAIKLASENLVEVEGVVKVGTGSVTSAKADALEIGTDIASVALDADGKVVHAFLDTMQSKGKVQDDGTVVGAGILDTKGVRGADYGMKGTSDLEWYEHRDEYVKWLVGRTADEAASEADLPSTVTITTSAFVAAFKVAFANATAVE